MKKRQVTIVLICIFILGGSLVASTQLSNMKEEPKKVASPERIKFVKTSPVSYGKVSTRVIAFGRVTSSLPLDVIPEVQGRITGGDIPLKEGQRFYKGMILFKVDDTEALLNLVSERSSFLKDLASILPDFKIDFSQSFEKWKNYFESIDVEKPLAELPAVSSSQEKTYLATKNIFTNYYSIKSKEINLTKHTIKAPFSGTISQVDFQTGSFVNPGTKIAKIVETGNLELKATVNIDEIKWIDKGKKAIISTEDQSRQWEGKVARIGQVVNPNTQSINIYVSIRSNKYPVYEGMYLRVSIPGESIDRVMEIDRRAVINTNQVYTVEDSLLKTQEIKIHKLNAESVIISGLTPGTDLVIEPLVNVYEGMKAVKLKLDDE